MVSWQFRYALLVLIPILLLLVSLLGYLGDTTAIVVFLPGWLLVEDFILNYMMSDTGLGMIVVSWAFWFSVGWVIDQLLCRHYARASVVALVLTAGFTYLCFRTTVYGQYTCHRTWGFITHVLVDSNGDGRTDGEEWYAWREPLIDAHSSALRSRSDQNFDGVWDTWVDHEANTLEIDRDGDGTRDATFEADDEGHKRARELLGVGP